MGHSPCPVLYLSQFSGLKPLPKETLGSQEEGPSTPQQRYLVVIPGPSPKGPPVTYVGDCTGRRGDTRGGKASSGWVVKAGLAQVQQVHRLTGRHVPILRVELQ